MKIYNTLSQSLEDFVPITPGKVTMYCCGPTVYGLLHVGNFRGAIFYNSARLWLEHLEYEVQMIYNFTDVDDKIIARGIEEGIPSSEVSEKYIKEFYQDFFAFGLKPHSLNPRVTEHMDDIIKLVQDLIRREYAYEKNGDVYYRVRKFSDYGCLSHRNVDDLVSGARVDV